MLFNSETPQEHTCTRKCGYILYISVYVNTNLQIVQIINNNLYIVHEKNIRENSNGMVQYPQTYNNVNTVITIIHNKVNIYIYASRSTTVLIIYPAIHNNVHDKLKNRKSKCKQNEIIFYSFACLSLYLQDNFQLQGLV